MSTIFIEAGPSCKDGSTSKRRRGKGLALSPTAHFNMFPTPRTQGGVVHASRARPCHTDPSSLPYRPTCSTSSSFRLAILLSLSSCAAIMLSIVSFRFWQARVSFRFWQARQARQARQVRKAVPRDGRQFATEGRLRDSGMTRLKGVAHAACTARGHVERHVGGGTTGDKDWRKPR